jgi:tetratricopeptide (TPR) repeat protein
MGARVITLPRRTAPPEHLSTPVCEVETECRSLWDHGEVDRAIERWMEAVRQEPSRPVPRHSLAKALMLLGRWEEASRQLNLCLTLMPGSAAVTAELAVCYIHMEQESNALLLLNDSLRVDAGNHLAKVALESFSAGPVGFNSAIDRALASSATPVEVCDLLFDVILVAPDCARALYELARVHEAAGRNRWAHLFYGRAIRSDPQVWQSYFNLARLSAVEGKHAAARPLLERAVLLRPSEFAPTWLLAQVCEQQDDRAEALFWLHRAKALDPAEPHVEVALARLAATPDEELVHLDAAVQLGCARNEVLFNLGHALWRKGRTNEARSVW